MKKNIGTIDASLRITVGLLGLAYGIGKMNRRPYRTPWLLMTLSAMKVAEGFTRFCPMLYAMGTNTKNEKQMGDFITNMVAKGDMMQNMSNLASKAIPAMGNAQGQKKAASEQPKQEPTMSEAEKAMEQEIRQMVGGVGNRQQESAKHPSSGYHRDEYRSHTYS
ncbi:YgaP family membrane protein [Brevibacillus fulvus]|uniref:Inner membrane protein YgaP-like transmembrane domain-containing protein n=1 Tax=Brevibacillus fulvus TaxID=1125967 RepID=A0A938XXM1_9BACL|nr:DUF2892 domain-containing protein [Brevibacillus fulvus]MBM7589528.1 hypothetical protein [Brevibacillus fulvus]